MLKLKRLCSSKNTIKKVKGQTTDRKRCLQGIYLTKEIHAEYIKYYKTVRKKITQKKNGQQILQQRQYPGVHKHRKTGRTLLVAKEVQIKITMRYYYIPPMWLKLKRVITPNPGENMKQHQTLPVQVWNDTTTSEYCAIESTTAEHTFLPSISTHRYRVNKKYTYVPKYILEGKLIVAQNWKQPTTIKNGDTWISVCSCDEILYSSESKWTAITPYLYYTQGYNKEHTIRYCLYKDQQQN